MDSTPQDECTKLSITETAAEDAQERPMNMGAMNELSHVIVVFADSARNFASTPLAYPAPRASK